MFSMHPQQFTSCGIERNSSTTRSGGCIQHAVDHQRRSLEFEFWTITDAFRTEMPSDLKFVKVGRVDLIQRPVPCAGEIRAVRRPLSIFEPHLSGEHESGTQKTGDDFELPCSSNHDCSPSRFAGRETKLS